MLHNSGPYGPNDVPINMGASVNMTQMPNPMNLGSNLSKIPQQTPQTSAPRYNIPDYSSYGHPPLNAGHSMTPFANYHHLNFQGHYSQTNPNLTQDMVPNSVQNNMLPMNLNRTSNHGPSLMNYHNYESKRLDVNNPQCIENFTRKMPINIPQVHSKTFHKPEIESHYGQYNSIQESPCQDLSKTPERTVIDYNRRKSLEHTVKLIENILINSTPKDKLKDLNSTESVYQTKLLRDRSVDQQMKNTGVKSIGTDNRTALHCNPNLSENVESIDQSHANVQISTQIKSTRNNIQDNNVTPTMVSKITDLKTGSQTTIDQTKTPAQQSNTTTTYDTVITKLPVTETKNEPDSAKNIQSELHCAPMKRSLLNNITDSNIKKETNDTDYEEKLSADNIKEEVTDLVKVKVEPMGCMEMDSVPFLRDSNATHRDNVEAGAMVVEENSVTEAREAMTKGSNPKTYYECPHCNLLFIHPKRFLIHTKWHSFGLTNEKRQELLREKERKKSMKKESKIIERLNSKEVKESAEGDSHPCKDCDKVFNAKSTLKNHRQRYHPTRVRQCKVCNASVVGWMALRAHMAAHTQTAAASHQCPECPKRFKYAHSLAKHRDTHKEKTHGCEQCEKKFGSQALLKMHMKCHERLARGATFRCTYCGKGFYESYNLQVHERTHRNERPFLCDICNTSFGTNSSLKRHLKVSHSTAKPFPCPTCHRCFVSAATRARHTSRAHGDPAAFAHACALCPRRYKAAKELHKHVSKAHPEQRDQD